MADHKYVPITEKLFKEHLAGEERCIFVTKEDIPSKIQEVIGDISQKNQKARRKGARIITELLSPLETEGVKRIAEKLWCRVTCKFTSKRLRYLCSDFGGHYSTDYYEFLEYTQIHVTLIARTKK